MSTPIPVVQFPDLVDYKTASHIQDRLVAARIAEEIGDVILLLEHRPVITLGRRRSDRYLLASPQTLRDQGIDLAVASRGGDVTYHGPGQLVLYPILKLDRQIAGAHGYLDQLETIAVTTAQDLGVQAFRREGKSGAWTQQGKIAAIGFRLKHWVSQHGMSFNVHPDLHPFRMIVPCGLTGEPVSSLHEILQEQCPSIHQTAQSMVHHMSQVFQQDLTVFPDPHKLPTSPLKNLLLIPPNPSPTEPPP